MPEFSDFKPGTFCWSELATSDPAGAKKFYGDIFGWSGNDMPAGPDMVYTMIQLGGKDVGGMFGLTDEMKSMGIPPNWLSYVAVASVDETTEKAKTLGATIMRDPMDVMDVGRMSVVQDPTGAVFALWQAKTHRGAVLANEHGAFSWNELATTNIDKAGKFYTELFGWSAQTQDMGTMVYTTFTNGDRPAGGMYAITPEMGDIPPNWLVYFAIDDCDKRADQIKKIGGQILIPPTDIPEIGRFAAALDPQGAAFAIITLLNPQS